MTDRSNDTPMDPAEDERELVMTGEGSAPEGDESEMDEPAEEISMQDLERLLAPENRELLYSIAELASQRSTDRTRLYAALMGASFLVPLSRPVNLPESPQEGTEMSLEVLTLTGPNGEPALPVFTHPDAIRRWSNEEPPTVSLSGQSIFQLCAASPMQFVLVNPAGPFGGQVARGEFEPLSQGLLPGVAPPGPPPGQPPIYIDVPLIPVPAETEERLREILEGNEAVQSAHLFLIQVGDSPPRLTLGVHVEGAAGQWVIPQLTRVLQKEALSFEPYEPPQLMRLDEVPGAESVRQGVPALFAREGSTAAAIGGSPEPGEEEDAGAEDLVDEDTDAEALLDEDAAGSAETASEPGTEPGEANPRRRSFWPFGRRAGT